MIKTPNGKAKNKNVAVAADLNASKKFDNCRDKCTNILLLNCIQTAIFLFIFNLTILTF